MMEAKQNDASPLTTPEPSGHEPETIGDQAPGIQAAAAFDSRENDEWTELFRRIAETAPARENSGDLPRAEVRALLAQGFGALIVPKSAGGRGLSYRELFGLVVRLAAADANVAHIFRNHYGFVNGLLSLADREKAGHWLARAAGGDLFANGVTDAVRPREADGRVADLSHFATTLRREGKAQILHGKKQYATGSVYADWLAIQATRDDESETLTVVVPISAPGVEVIDDWAGFGQRFTASGTANLHEVRIEHDAQVLQRSRTLPGAEYGSSLPQLFLTAVIAGIVQASFDDALALIKSRKQHLYFAPSPDPTADPLLLHALGQLSAHAYAARSIILNAAESFDRAAALPFAQRSEANHAAALNAAHAKVSIDALGTAAATLLFDLGGASATHRQRQLDRHWRNARTVSTHNPSLYKALAIGAYHARGEPLPKQGFF
ncbi:acyl-CoA dehydrogenase family protein [Achromobacter veterisilvae]|uniref:Acyl-CoA dehydrogenase family protein n=1 Tax=Achromobacter veterisilvae TaxID=2069367 RepID=A0ABZ2S2Y1_9BURK